MNSGGYKVIKSGSPALDAPTRSTRADASTRVSTAGRSGATSAAGPSRGSAGPASGPVSPSFPSSQKDRDFRWLYGDATGKPCTRCGDPTVPFDCQDHPEFARYAGMANDFKEHHSTTGQCLLCGRDPRGMCVECLTDLRQTTVEPKIKVSSRCRCRYCRT